MSRAVRIYGVYGVWDRQPELLKEAEELHRASAAARAEASRRRASREERSGRGSGVALPRPGRPQGLGYRRGAAARRSAGGASASSAARSGARTPRTASSWRTAAARVGASLVTIGRRLERYGARQRG